MCLRSSTEQRGCFKKYIKKRTKKLFKCYQKFKKEIASPPQPPYLIGKGLKKRYSVSAEVWKNGQFYTLLVGI